MSTTTEHTPISNISQSTQESINSTSENILPGQVFHMDMGFIQSKKYNYRDEYGQLVMSIDGYNTYLVIVNCATWYTWLFLTRHKTPPIDIIRGFLNTHGTKTTALKRV
jgi:hypothetical protein